MSVHRNARSAGRNEAHKVVVGRAIPVEEDVDTTDWDFILDPEVAPYASSKRGSTPKELRQEIDFLRDKRMMQLGYGDWRYWDARTKLTERERKALRDMELAYPYPN